MRELLKKPVKKSVKKLASHIEGDVFWDYATCMLYASDASIFQQLPDAVVRPKHAEDCAAILRFANQHEITIIPRAAGTSLAGQCVGSGLVVDVLHHMHHIIKLDARPDIEQATVTVEPGVVLQDLNDSLKPYGLCFPIDPSTANRCTIGGMVGNNAWGIHTPRYGTTRDHVVSIDALMADGSSAQFSQLNKLQLTQKLALKNREGEFYRSVCQAVEHHHELIAKELHPEGVLRSNTGYALTAIVKTPDWKKHLNLAPFLCGSEGTLVFMTAITLKLSPLPDQKPLICAHFNSLSAAVEYVPEITSHAITALELLDYSLLDASTTSPAQQQNRLWIEAQPEAVLLIECESDDQVRNIQTCLQHTDCYASPVIKPPDSHKVWALRRAGLALLMGRQGTMKTVSAIEDAAVPMRVLAEYVNRVEAVMQRYDLACVYYGPVSVGTVHIRPWMDLSLSSERQRFITLQKDIASIVHELGGVISSKHGDGRVRGWLLPGLLDETLYAVLRSIKDVADPKGILNPSSILTSVLPDTNLRTAVSAQKPVFKTAFNWQQEGGIQAAIQQCNGAGVCLKSTGNGTMCPSYQASHHEQHGTRGRANTLRLLFQQQEVAGLFSDEAHAALDLCLSCKACKTECPAGVDMARLKAEALQQRYDRFGVPVRTRLAANYYRMSQFASKRRGLFNHRLFRKQLPRLFGMHKNRSLPKLASQTFEHWLRLRVKRRIANQNNQRTFTKGKVVLINDAQINYYEPDIGIATVETLECLGFEVIVTPCIHSTQVFISHGLVRKAKQQLASTVLMLLKLSRGGLDIIGLEPSELLTFRDDVAELLTEKQSLEIESMLAKTYLFEEFILKHDSLITSRMAANTEKKYPILVHEHCHQKSLCKPDTTKKCLSLIDHVKVSTIPSGCCGMAGSFGYEKDHYTLSMQIAELVLFPAIREAADNPLVVATGASCRQQILDGMGWKALHPAEVFRLMF